MGNAHWSRPEAPRPNFRGPPGAPRPLSPGGGRDAPAGPWDRTGGPLRLARGGLSCLGPGSATAGA